MRAISLLREGANKIRRIVGAASPSVFRDLGIRAERARPVHLTGGQMGSRDLGRRFALLDPLFEGAQRIEREGAGPTGTVLHPRHHERR